MNDSILKDLLNEYDYIQNTEARALNLRRKEIYERLPKVLELEREIISILAEQSKKRILNPNLVDSKNTYDEDIEKLKAEIQNLLESNGYPDNYLDMHYHCPKCMDTGFIGTSIRERCTCLTQKILDKSYESSNINLLEDENFEKFNPEVFPEITLENSNQNQRQYMIEMKNRLLDYSQLFPENDRKTILFTGKTGLGKSFLLNCMAKEIMDKGYTVLAISAYKLFDQLFFSAISDRREIEAMERRLYETDLLIIDDLGTETRRNNFTSEDLFNILNERNLKNAHTFISTNLSIKDLRDRYSDRIVSRLMDTSTTMLFRFQGKDIRRLKSN